MPLDMDSKLRIRLSPLSHVDTTSFVLLGSDEVKWIKNKALVNISRLWNLDKFCYQDNCAFKFIPRYINARM